MIVSDTFHANRSHIVVLVAALAASMRVSIVQVDVLLLVINPRHVLLGVALDVRSVCLVLAQG